MKIHTLVVLFFTVFSTELLAQYESMVTVEKHIRTIEVKADGTSIETEEEIDKIETQKGIDVSEEKLNEELGSGYGIFSGKTIKWATLKFTAERARWVAQEKWHPKQEGQFLKDGSYQLKVPYSKEPELIIDVMKYGPDVEVTAPEDLRKKIQATLIKTLEKYENR